MVLHAHLPFVRHPEYEEFLEEDWLYQAITETYIPLLQVYDGLVREGVPFRLTMSLTPTLLSMLADPLLQSRYLRFLNRSLELAHLEKKRTESQPEFQPAVNMYLEKLQQARHLFVDQYRCNLIKGFRRFQDIGVLEIITCGATHGFLPMMTRFPQAVRAQIEVAVQTHERHLGRKPRGIWLPECAYQPGVEAFLKEAGIEFFFVDTHGILNGVPRPRHGVHSPIQCSNGVVAFGRDAESSKQVWSSKEGYPGDFEYRDFYRDIGFDLDYDTIRPYIASTGDRKMTGFKYYRITGPSDHKEPYIPERALDKAAEHAGNFMFNRERQIEYLADMMGRPPVVVAPYDAELFGHWWYEGPRWLDFLIRKSAYDQNVFKLVSPMDYLKQVSPVQSSEPAASSWGYKGFYEHWLSPKNDWVYRHLQKAAERMIALAQNYPSADGLLERALNQAARELLLAQGSDWAFIMFADTMVEYAVKRTKTHLNNFNRLRQEIHAGTIEESALSVLEKRNNIFPEIDFRVYR